LPKFIQLKCQCLDEYVDGLSGQELDEQHFDHLFGGENVDVFKPDGSLLLKLRCRAVSVEAFTQAYPVLWRAAQVTDNRGTAAGGTTDADEFRRIRDIKRDGTIGRTHRAKSVRSGIIGYFDRNARFPYCRKTSFTGEEVARWLTVLPFVREVNSVFREACPDRYAAQLAVVERTHPHWVISGTVFTTVTVNRNFRTATHKDAGDLPEGFGVMSVLQAGHYEGGYLIFPKYRVAVDMRSRDVLLADVHEWHGNSPIIGVEGKYERVSTVMYYRTNMQFCLSPKQELERVRHRKHGDLVNG
jgi:hypothetical protein